jgi:hypothetical protein
MSSSSPGSTVTQADVVGAYHCSYGITRTSDPCNLETIEPIDAKPCMID